MDFTRIGLFQLRVQTAEGASLNLGQPSKLARLKGSVLIQVIPRVSRNTRSVRMNSFEGKDERFLVTMRNSSAQYCRISVTDSITDSCMNSKISPAKAVPLRIGALLVTPQGAACLTGKTERETPDANVVDRIPLGARAAVACIACVEKLYGVRRAAKEAQAYVLEGVSAFLGLKPFKVDSKRKSMDRCSRAAAKGLELRPHFQSPIAAGKGQRCGARPDVV